MSFQRRKVRIGRVVSDKMDKTVVVVVEWRRRHPLYKKSILRRTRFKAHDEENTCRVGDLVRIRETRPLSRTKRWRVVEVLERAELPELLMEELKEEKAVAETATAEAAEAQEEPAAQAAPEHSQEGEEPETEEEERG